MAEPERIGPWGLGGPIRQRWHQVESEDPAAPLPGYLCEACLDAPAIALVPAPGGGETFWGRFLREYDIHIVTLIHIPVAAPA
jgi:hypothetical protein